MNHITVLKESQFSLSNDTGTVNYILNGMELSDSLLRAEDALPSTDGIRILNPIQTVFTKHYTSNNAIISAPTSAGKTLIALLFFFRQDPHRYFIYMSPTRALAHQSYLNFKKYFKATLKLSGYEDAESDSNPSEYGHIIITTYEAFVTAIRNKVPWALNVSAIVIDEFHQISFSERGILIEEIAAWILNNKIPVLCLSATLPGGIDVMKWTDSNLYIESRWRPVPLERQFITMQKNQQKVDLIESLIQPDEKSIVFVGSKREGWTLLKNLYKEGYKIINKTLTFDTSKTNQIWNKGFCAFHCSDIPTEEQREIEERFKNDPSFRILIATQTLAYGMNLPTDHVIIFVGMKYPKGTGVPIIWPPPSDIIQMEGRAGRLGLREKGRSSICITSPRYTKEIITSIKQFYSSKFTTALEEAMKEDKDSLYLIVLASLIYSSNPKEFLKRTWVLRDRYPLFDVFIHELTRLGFVQDRLLTTKGLFAVKSGLTPGRVIKFLNYHSFEKTSPVSLTPLLRNGFSIPGTGFIPVEEINHILTEWWNPRDEILKDLNPFIQLSEDIYDTTEFGIAAYTHGIFFYKPSIHSLPGGFGRLYQDREYILRALLIARSLGLTSHTDKEILLLTASLESGLPVKWVYLSCLKNIGYFSGHALIQALKQCEIAPPKENEPIDKYFRQIYESDLVFALRWVFQKAGREDRTDTILKNIRENYGGTFQIKRAIQDTFKKIKGYTEGN